MTSTSRPTRNAVRLGLRRGWTEFAQSIRSTQDQGFYLFTGAATVGYLFLRRDTQVEGTDLLLPSVALPSILGAFIAFGVIIGPAYALAMEKEDGTLLRHKAVPHGLQGYFTGQLLKEPTNSGRHARASQTRALGCSSAACRRLGCLPGLSAWASGRGWASSSGPLPNKSRRRRVEGGRRRHRGVAPKHEEVGRVRTLNHIPGTGLVHR